VYKAVCAACHDSGAAGAPKFGDKAAWAPRLKQGLDKLTENAIKGKGAMPPKGGAAQLGETEIALAVIHMVDGAGGVQAAAPEKAPEKPAAAPAPVKAAAPAGDKGKDIYTKACAACHASGAAGAPKFGDKAAWGPRIATGKPALYNSALKGKGAMPAKGGNAALADDDVKAAVDYMVSQAK
jgi:cytochrome c5